MNSSGCYIDSQGLRTAGKYLFPGFCRSGIFRFAGIFRVLWISHRNIGGEWQDVFRLADRSRIGRTTTEQGAACMRTGLKTVAGDRMYPPPPSTNLSNALVAVACGYSLACHRGGRCCCSTMANEKSQPIINQLRFYFRVPRTIFENCNFIPFVNTLIFSCLWVYCKDNQYIVIVDKIV